jgi:hypothetical protein
MTRDRYLECLDILDMSDTRLIRLTNADPRAVRRWRTGERAVHHAIAEWLEALVAHWEINPPPVMLDRAREIRNRLNQNSY